MLRFIMLSGLPCSGKSTWRELLVAKLKQDNIPVTVVSSDDIALQMAKRRGQTYATMNTTYRPALEAAYKAAVMHAKKQNRGLVILDRTYLAARWRKELLGLIGSDSVAAVIFKISNDSAWRHNLKQRNANHPEKNITEQIIASLSRGASLPTQSEGFATVLQCCAVGEMGWEKAFTQTIDAVIRNYKALEPELTN